MEIKTETFTGATPLLATPCLNESRQRASERCKVRKILQKWWPMLWDSYENSCSDPGASVRKNSPQIHRCSDSPPWLLKTGTLNTWVSSPALQPRTRSQVVSGPPTQLFMNLSFSVLWNWTALPWSSAELHWPVWQPWTSWSPETCPY